MKSFQEKEVRTQFLALVYHKQGFTPLEGEAHLK
jgi:hypothetical protein